MVVRGLRSPGRPRHGALISLGATGEGSSEAGHDTWAFLQLAV